MGSRRPGWLPLGLRARFLTATALLVLTTVTASIWTLGALSRMSAATGESLRINDQATKAIAQVASALEREDDALLLVFTGEPAARPKLAAARSTVDSQIEHLRDALRDQAEEDLVADLRVEVDAYRRASDAVTGDPPSALFRYHREVNPLLRIAVGYAGKLRDRHFDSAQSLAADARSEVVRARGVVLAIGSAALLVSVLIALHLARIVIVPLIEMTRRARAIANENFDDRLAVDSNDELGELATAFNEMASHIAELRRIDLDAVLRAKNALESTLQALPDAVFLFDIDRRVVSLNRRARQLLGLALEASLESVEATDLSIAERSLLSLLDEPSHGDAPTTDFSSTLVIDWNGSRRRLLPRALSVQDARDERPGSLLVLYDVTELAKLDEMRGELIAVASHELRTPLTTLRMALLMLAEKVEHLEARQRELISTCLSGVAQLGDTIDEFLDLTRIEAGQLRLSFELVELCAVARDAVRRWETHANAQEVLLTLETTTDVFVRADRARLRVVLDNLLSNAFKYTPAGGRVRVVVSRVGPTDGVPTARLSVEDSGVGIPTEYRARIFDKFFRVEHHTSVSDDGTRGVGIGLYLCRQIVTRHGGAIWCEAREGSVGTTLLLELPEAA